MTSTDLVRRYLDCWNETDPVTRRRLVGDPFADGARYVDPMVDVAGSDVALLDSNGRITAVHGFLDRVPASA